MMGSKRGEGRVASLPILCAAFLFLGTDVLNAAETPAGSAEPALAKEILDATGIRGGLIVHLGCGDGKLTAALRAGDGYLVHGLDPAPENVERARRHIRSLGLYGKVSADRSSGKRLPYVDNLVSLLVAEQRLDIPADEVLRVLAPGGVAYVREDGRWTKTVKPWPEEIDQWTHFLHDATGNAVADDTRAGPPRHMQWTAEPTWTRNHHTLASISAVVSAEGRVFYIVDEGPPASMQVPGKWFLVARDAFNGVFLWKRPIGSWAWHRHKFRSGPVQLPRTLVAGADRVYAPLGLGAPLTAFDAATGEPLRTYEKTKGTEEVILDEGVLLVVTGSPVAEQAAIGPARSTAGFPNEKSIVAVRAETGDVLWTRSQPAAAKLMPLTLAAGQQRVFFQAGNCVVCLDRDTGAEQWQWPPERAGQDRRKRGPGVSNATLVVRDDVVLWADGKRLSALSADAGDALWECDCRAGFRSPPDVFVTGGLVWTGPDFSQGRDLRTGEVKKTSTAVQDIWTVGHHHRCYREKATSRYILTGKRGIEFLDLVSDNHTRNNWVRGTCQYGVMPCNGLIYAPSHACGCFMEAKLYGFWALAPESAARRDAAVRPPAASVAGKSGRAARARPGSMGPRLEQGPAFGQATAPRGSAIAADSGDWPMHRHDPLRSGSTATEIPLPLEELWKVDVGPRPSAPVVADGVVVVSLIEDHRVVALDARDGKTRWHFAPGGRVDSPPTIHQGLVLFGSADGWVYALRLADGELVWRFHAAPGDLNTVALDQVESVWPVHGSVLVQNGVAYAAAGRSSYLDGGILLYGLDPATGKILCRSRVSTQHPVVDKTKSSEISTKKIDQNATDYKTFTGPDRSDAFSMGGVTTDILVGDGTAVYLRHLKFDRDGVQQEQHGRHLFSTSRLLDDAENHRSHWVLGGGDFSRLPVAYSWIANPLNGRGGWRLGVPYGLLLAFDEETVWGARRNHQGGYLLFAAGNRPFTSDEQPPPDFTRSDGKLSTAWKWSVPLSMRPRAMLRSGNILLVGGMPLAADPADLADLTAAYAGRKGGLVWAASASDGTGLAEIRLASPPVFDGMAAAADRLYLATTDGKLLCFGGP